MRGTGGYMNILLYTIIHIWSIYSDVARPHPKSNVFMVFHSKMKSGSYISRCFYIYI